MDIRAPIGTPVEAAGGGTVVFAGRYFDDGLTRGMRLDPERSGSWLGLSIAGDIAAPYGGDPHLDESALGGLPVSVALPIRGS